MFAFSSQGEFGCHAGACTSTPVEENLVSFNEKQKEIPVCLRSRRKLGIDEYVVPGLKQTRAVGYGVPVHSVGGR